MNRKTVWQSGFVLISHVTLSGLGAVVGDAVLTYFFLKKFTVCSSRLVRAYIKVKMF